MIGVQTTFLRERILPIVMVWRTVYCLVVLHTKLMKPYLMGGLMNYIADSMANLRGLFHFESKTKTNKVH